MLLAVVFLITNTMAVLCLLAVPFWGLGAPGVPSADSAYTQGWKLGFGVLFVYPLATLINYFSAGEPGRGPLLRLHS